MSAKTRTSTAKNQEYQAQEPAASGLKACGLKFGA